MKKIISTLLSLALVIGMCPAMIANAEVTLSGTGVENDPYIIATAEDLKLARDLINANANGEADACFKVTSDIDLNNEPWTPIAPYGAVPFTGTFNGDKHVISNINIELNEDNYSNYTAQPNLGFFGCIGDTGSNGGTVNELGLNGVKVINNLDYNESISGWKGRPNAMGGFIGRINRNSVISNCFVKNATLSQNGGSGNYVNIGGFFGTTAGGQNPQLTNCYVYNTEITAGQGSPSYRDTIGGFAATPGNAKTTFTNCYVAQTFTTQASAERTAFYAFSRKGSSTATSATNCYAEADDIATVTDATNTDGTHKTTWDYDATTSLGTTGMTKAGLVEAMTAVGYVTDATVNDGYPCFGWEIKTVAAEPWDGVAATEFADGDGSEEDPYQITTAAELKLAADTVNNYTAAANVPLCFSLENDIDYEDNLWTPIGKSNSTGTAGIFAGVFDGNNHVVRNLTIDDEENQFCGFFGLARYAEIKDLGIEEFTLVHANRASTETAPASNKMVIGGFVGQLGHGTKVSNCYLKNSSVKQTTAFSSGTKKLEAVLGGFVGYIDPRNAADNMESVEITNCYVDNVELQCGTNKKAVCGFIGGFTAYNDANARPVKITNCYANTTNAVATNTQFGFGWLTDSFTFDPEKVVLTNCYSTMATVEGTSTYKSELKEGTYFGTTGASVETIAGVFESLEGWQDGENINAGLPALAWEPAPVILPYVVKQVSTAKDTVTLEINKADTTGDKIYIATYDSEGRLIAADVQNVAATVTTAVSADDAATVKVFIWNSNNNPVIDATVKDLY